MANHYSILLLASVFGLSLLISPTILIVSHAQTNTANQSGNSSNVSENFNGGVVAQDVYQNRMITFGDNVKNIIILLPNEGHESPAYQKNRELSINHMFLKILLQVPELILFGSTAMLGILIPLLYSMRILMKYILAGNLILIL